MKKVLALIFMITLVMAAAGCAKSKDKLEAYEKGEEVMVYVAK